MKSVVIRCILVQCLEYIFVPNVTYTDGTIEM